MVRTIESIAFSNTTWPCVNQIRIFGRLIDESPKWLRASGKSEEATRIENKIARFNKQPHDSIVKEETLTGETIDILGVWETIKKLSHKPVLVVRVLVLSLAW